MPGKPRERRKQKSRERILETTAGLIVSKGFENVSLRDVARKSDYSPAALYKYFDSKAALMAAVRDTENARLVSEIRSIPETLAPEPRLVEMCMVYIRFNLQNPAYTSLINSLPTDFPPADAPLPDHSPFMVFLQAVAAWGLAEGVDFGGAAGLEEATYWLWTLVHGMATLQQMQLSRLDRDFPAADRRGVENLLRGMRVQK